MKNIPAIILLFLLPGFAKAQSLTGIASRFDDSFIEWLFYTDDEEAEGELKIRWQFQQDDFTEWDYRIGETFGTIQMKWKDKPDEWELRGDNKIISARTLWNGDFREWRITNNSVSLTLKTKWGNQWDEWHLRDGQHGQFTMYTSFEHDPRDWVVIDELDEDVPFEMKMMLMFIVVFNSSPKQ
jgi:hypothetical protein